MDVRPTYSAAGRDPRLLRASSLVAGLLVALIASTARGDGVGLVTASKTLPPATVAVIDPESGTSSGGGTTDVRLAAGDVILFRFNMFPVPNAQIHGLNGWLTEYLPANTEVVGVRLIDANGETVRPNYPGLAIDSCGRSCNGFNSVPSSSGPRNLDDGSMAQLYADTGVFYTTDARLGRSPSTSFITLASGITMTAPPTRIGDIDGILGATAPYFIHNMWDWANVRAFGISNPNGNVSGNNGTGNTPHLYGSPVAGALTHYRYEVTEVSPGTIQFNDVVGPWQRVQYPGSLIGTGGIPGTGPRNSYPLTRLVADASTMGHDLTPLNPLPSSARALRIALGEVRVGEPVNVEVALRVLGTPIDPVQMQDVNCGESFGGDTSARSSTGRADDNMWSMHLGSPACVFLNLLFDLTSDQPLAVGGDVVEFTLRTKNLSINPQSNVWVRQKYNSSRVSLSGTTPFPDVAPTCMVSNCDGDGLDCLYWSLATLDPSEDISIRTNFTIGGGGQVTHVMRADYTSAALGTVTGTPCAGGSVSSPGFRTQTTNMIRGVGVVQADLASITPTAPPGGTTSFTGTIGVGGTQSVGLDETIVVLPTGWTVRDTNANTIPDVQWGASRVECSANCATNRPEFNLATSLTEGTSRAFGFTANVPGGTATGVYPVDLSIWGSQTGFGGRYETYFNDLAFAAVGAPRSDPPALTCPLLSSWTSIPGTTTEADGTVIRVFFAGVQRASGSASSGGFAVGGFGATFGPLYGGLEVRATAQAPGENESELSVPCFVTAVSECQDGLDNDGDGLVDFPADPGCSSPTDGDEGDPECSDGVDNDGDGDFDWPADRECDGPDDDTEGGLPACMDGVDNDGDGATDWPADSDCTNAMDRTEVTLRRCMNGQDDDGDGLFDYPADPGCHSANDDDELDFVYPADDVRARLLFVFDTSGSMNWHACADEFTGGDGSAACGGGDVSCATCPASIDPSCGNGIADDSRIYQARQGVRSVVSGFGEVEYGLMRFHQRPRAFGCATTNASEGSGGWQGAGPSPCGGGFSGGDVLVGFSPENEYDLLEWMDGDSNYPGGGEPPAALDFELRGSGTTPISGSLDDARTFLGDVRAADTASSCRPYRVILLTDGQETCGGDPVASSNALRLAGFPVHVIGFATPDPTVRATLNAIATAGGTDGGAPGGDTAIFVSDATALSASISDIVNSSILTEVCDGIDNDCDALVDEGYTLYCNVPGGVSSPTLCADPGETVCNGVDDNCDGAVDEGLRNACGTCGAAPVEICNGVDDDCDGPVDEGGVCSGCIPQPEICNNLDDDCDGTIDDGLARGCSSACGSGLETCAAGGWSGCTAPPAGTETCNGLDEDCDGLVDEGTSSLTACGVCGEGTLRCVGGAPDVCVGDRSPMAETCNARDDDCNGLIDDGPITRACSNACGSGFEVCTVGVFGGCTAPSAGTETCNNADEDCDGRIDEGVTRACSTACGAGVESCVAGSFVGCDAPTPSPEVCNGIDDNCDGSTDEGNPGGGASCASGVGVCVTGTTVCTAGALACICPPGFTSVLDAARGPFCVPAGSSLMEVCDGTNDEDCDGLVDESLTRSCSTICGSGTEVCSGGGYTGCTAPTPDVEACDNFDNDCDGAIDESLTRACGTDVGECSTGLETCALGAWGACSGVEPAVEICNTLDDDCDGRIDEGLDLGLPCGDGRGECVPGSLTCVSGAIVCGCPPGFARRTRVEADGTITELCAPDDGGTGPLVESCNALDDDCDGPIDEGLPLGGTCGDTEGACVPGMEQCLEGRVVCVGEVPAGPEVCDCEDNDCDGSVDEDPTTGSLCPGTSICLDCSCALPCLDSEFGRCPAGRIPVEDAMGCYCVAPRCNPDTCVTETVTRDGDPQCAPDDPDLPICGCRMNECTFPCDGVTCATPTVCAPLTGRCVEDNCHGLGCPSGEICDPVTVLCVVDPCETAGCASDEACRMGTCEPSCATATCAAGEICQGGVCAEDLCAGVTCASGERCDPADGTCQPDMCDGVSCPPGASCDFLSGTCRADECTFVRCPSGQRCFRGECELETMSMEDAGVLPDGAVVLPDGAVVLPDGGGMDGGRPPDLEDRVLAAGGCMCEAAGAPRSGARGGLALLFSLLGLVTWRRRRNG